MYYIIYLSDLSLESKYAENESMKEVFKRLKILYGMNNSENPNKDVSFLSNFSILFELLNDFPQLKENWNNNFQFIHYFVSVLLVV